MLNVSRIFHFFVLKLMTEHLFVLFRFKTLRLFRDVAQLVEHWSPKPGVASSSLAIPAIKIQNLIILMTKRYFLYLFLTIYVLFLVLGIFFQNALIVTLLKLLGIMLCLIYVIIFSRKDLFLIIAFSFTFLADIFLAINNASIVGVFVFCLAQFSHLMRLKKMPRYAPIIFYTGTTFVFAASIVLKIDAHFPLAIIYGLTLLANLLLSRNWFIKKHTRPAKCAFSGFSLFLCCDILVAMSFLSNTSVLPIFIGPIADYFAWFFYLPSQVLLANSSTKKSRS